VLFGAAALFSVAVLLPWSNAADPTPSKTDLASQVRDFAAAGEFAPAVRLAQQAPTAAQRDALLAAIAVQQQQAGGRNAALQTSSEIDNEALRAQTYQNLNGSAGPMAQGGGSQADFDSLIELVTSTVRPTTWDAVGGPGSIKGFEGGIFVDPAGLLKRSLREDSFGTLNDLKNGPYRTTKNDNAKRSSALRKISLTQLEREVQRKLAQGEPLSEEMLSLAGLERIRYVFLYPETHEIILAGPAGDWHSDVEGRIVNTETGHPVVRLDDLVVILRHVWGARDESFGCSIDPTKAGLQSAQAYANESAKTPLKEGQAESWLKSLAGKVGKQNVTVYGIDPQTRAGRVLVEADYRMKLVGLGLEDSVLGVPSYLGSIHLENGQAPPALDLIRWWFTLNYDAIQASKDHNAFELRGQAVQVQSENEFLNAQGNRVATGAAEPLNRQFAENFTKHFPALARKYSIYGDLQNLFDLAVVSALLKAEDAPNRIGWHGGCFVDPAAYPVPLAVAPRQVDTVANQRVFHQMQIVAVVSGGVQVNPAKYVERSALQLEDHNVVTAVKDSAARTNQDRHAWWWD
jgi:hypothetical protein